MADFLLELFSEEIPARLQPAARAQLHTRFEQLLAASGLAAATIATHSTPRRLALVAEGLPETSVATSEERRGPRVGAPDAAIAGFLKSLGLASVADLEVRDTPKGEFYFATLGRAGESAAAILAAQLPALIHGFQWPKSQRWGAASAATDSPRWIRPLRAIIALLGRDVVEFEALGVRSGRETYGHRILGGAGRIGIDRPGSYAAQLRASFVILSADERMQLIGEGAERAAAAAGFALRESPALAEENAGLVEWPVVLAGSFDPGFLDVPPEIVELTMATNQKYFALEDAVGALAPGFVCVANLAASDGGKAIIAGNQRVLSARLHDARFFWEQDKATPLEDFAARLSRIMFHAQIGSMADKVERMVRLAGWLLARGIVANPSAGRLDDAQFAAVVARAARLAKADLCSGTVGEFPELQGVAGGHLARQQGEDAHVVAALGQHYQTVPEDAAAVAVALADRIDTLVEFFAIGETPTGSRDPFALRRAALSVIAIIVRHGLRLPLAEVVRAACGDAAKFAAVFDGANGLAGFFIDRLKVQQREAGVRHDLIDAAVSYRAEGGAVRRDDDIVRLLAREAALQEFLGTADGADLLAGYRRAANILKAEEKKDGREFAWMGAVPAAAGLAPAEAALLAILQPTDAPAFDTRVADCLAREDFAGAMQLLATLREPVDRFFDEVKVNDADAAVRARRLGLLAGLRDTMHRVADFSRIEG